MAELGRSTQVGVRTASTGTYTNIGTIVSVDGPNLTIGETEATLLSSTFKPYLPTIPEGELTLNIQHGYADTGVTLLKTLLVVPVPVAHWQITYPDGYIDTFDGFAKGYSISGVENESIINAAVPIRMTSNLVTTAPTS